MPIDERKQRDSDLGEVATTVGGLLTMILRRGRFVAGQWTLPNGRVVTPKQVEALLLRIERVGGRRAVRVLYMGASLLLLSYAGSRFVMEILLGRAG